MIDNIVEILPKSISVESNGRINNEQAVSAMLLVTCIRPNVLKEFVCGEVRKISLVGNQAYRAFNFSTAEDIVNNQIIKTNFQGRSVIKVELVVSTEAGILNKVFSTAFSAVAGMVKLANPLASALVDFGSDGLKDAIKKRHITSLGQGLALINGNDLPGEIEIPLQVKAPLYSIDEYDDFDMVGEDDDSRALLLPKGAANGNVVLVLQAIDP